VVGSGCGTFWYPYRLWWPVDWFGAGESVCLGEGVRHSNNSKRQKILSEWGKEFFPLLSVHTLEIGYDVPEVRVAIILATSSNMNNNEE